MIYGIFAYLVFAYDFARSALAISTTAMRFGDVERESDRKKRKKDPEFDDDEYEYEMEEEHSSTSDKEKSLKSSKKD